MSQFAEVWNFTRARLAEAIEGLSEEQLAWRLYPDAHNVFELVYHVAGVEHYWATRLTGLNPSATEYEALLDLAVHGGFLRPGVGGPFRESKHLSARALNETLDFTEARLKPVMENPTDAQLQMVLSSPTGQEVVGHEALAQIAQHASYHTGQIWLASMSPKFPV